MKHLLNVLFHGQRVGTLRLLKGKLSFAYDANYAAQSGASAVSFALPVQAAPFNEAASVAFFAGLLPEGAMRRVLSKQLGISEQNDFALLREIGGECAGAVSLVSPDAAPAPSDLTASPVAWLTEPQLAQLLKDLPTRPMLAGQDGLRLSLAGAQEKLPVCLHHVTPNGSEIGISLPNEKTISSHIIKPPILGIEDSVLNEAFCMSLARTMSLPASEVTTPNLGGTMVYMVQRYDRQLLSDGNATRLHQEDFCQALGVRPNNKYQTEGGPNISDCFELIRMVSKHPANDVINLLDAMIFNVLIGNNDAHAKNFSILYGEKGPRLAPMYDALSTAVYPALTDKMAMKLGGKYRFDEIHNEQWEKFAKEARLSVSITKKRVKQIAELLPFYAYQMLSTPDYKRFAASSVVQKIFKLLVQRCELTLKRLK